MVEELFEEEDKEEEGEEEEEEEGNPKGCAGLSQAVLCPSLSLQFCTHRVLCACLHRNS